MFTKAGLVPCFSWSKEDSETASPLSTYGSSVQHQQLGNWQGIFLNKAIDMSQSIKKNTQY